MTRGDYLLAGRRLGVFSYAGAMSALVLGGASTVGGVALGYKHGLSGAWLVVAIALGLAALSALFAKRLAKLGVGTVTQMLELRYGSGSTLFPGLVMVLYTFMLAVTSTLAYATIFRVVFGLPDWAGILIGGTIVLAYSLLGGMWSITLTDIVQLIVTTIGLLLVLLPLAIAGAGGFEGMSARLDEAFFSPWSIGGATIVTYLVTFSLGMLIGQDIWQRLFTARTPRVAVVGGLGSAAYAILYGLAGALIGMAARVLLPDLPDPDDAFAAITQLLVAPGVRGLVFAAALAAMMSTASGAIIACATVLSDVVTALVISYNILVAGLLVSILGGMLWPRATLVGAYAAMAAGTLAVLTGMFFIWDRDANEPVYFGLGLGLVVFVAASLATRPIDSARRAEWDRRLARSDRTDLSTASAASASRPDPAPEDGGTP